jgi:hypothetical protein
MEDRRVTHRYKLPLAVTVLPLGGGPSEIHATTRDVSTTGVYFTLDQRLPVGVKLDLSLSLPAEVTDGSPVVVDAQARVTRVDERSAETVHRFGIAAVIERFNVSPVAVDFALHKAEQIGAANWNPLTS